MKKSCRCRRDEASGRAPGNSRKLEGPAEVTWRSVRDWERLLASGEGQLESAAGGRREGGVRGLLLEAATPAKGQLLEDSPVADCVALARWLEDSSRVDLAAHSGSHQL